MKTKFISASWPYLHTLPGIHNLMPMLAADAYARFCRLKGDKVLFICGTDEYGARAELMARRVEKHPQILMDDNYKILRKLLLEWLQLSLTKFPRTTNTEHKEFVQKFYKKLHSLGFVKKKEVELPYCESCERFLPDRFIVGMCPKCNASKIFENPCPICEEYFTPNKLKKSRCRLCKGKIIKKSAKRWFFDLPHFKNELTDYLNSKTNWSVLVRSEAKKSLLFSEPFMLTRAIKWGIPEPFDMITDNTIYCWAESLLGNIAAMQDSRKEKEIFKGKSTSVYFMGRDNIPFYAILLPSLLLSSKEGYTLPDHIIAHNFLKFRGRQCSKSNGNGIWIDEAKQLVPNPDCWRYYLIMRLPFDKNVNFEWDDFVSLINSDLVEKINIFISTVSSKTIEVYGRKFNIKNITKEEAEDFYIITRELINSINSHFNKHKLQDALYAIITFVQDSLEKIHKITNEGSLNCNLYKFIFLCQCFAVMIYPFLPSTSEKIWHHFGFNQYGSIEKSFHIFNAPPKEIKGEIHDMDICLFQHLSCSEIVRKFNLLPRPDMNKLEPIGEYCEKWSER